MKKITAFFVLLFCITTAYASKINQIVFIGDSLTDNGNLYKTLLHFLPKSPPYYEGRFSNGPTWSDLVSQYYADKEGIKSENYAVGGSTAVFHAPSSKFISPSTLGIQIDKYLVDSLFKDRSASLYVIWIGDNDYMYDTNGDVDVDTQKVVDKVTWAISKLAYYGADHFLIMNLVDASRTPKVQLEGTAEIVHSMVVLHNQRLAAALDQIKTQYPNVKVSTVDVYDLLNDLMDNPDKYNKQYNMNIKNTKEACWGGGYWLKQQLTGQALRDDVTQGMRANAMNLPADADFGGVSKLIENSPELAYTYSMSKAYSSGVIPCDNPDEHLFWDEIHPTAAVHKMLSQVVIQTLGDDLN